MLAPEHVLRRCGAPAPEPARSLVRLLGVRHLGEGVTLVTTSHSRLTRWCGAVDAIHACTMPLLVIVRPAFQRAAAFSLMISGALALLEDLGVRERASAGHGDRGSDATEPASG